MSVDNCNRERIVATVPTLALLYIILRETATFDRTRAFLGKTYLQGLTLITTAYKRLFPLESCIHVITVFKVFVS